MLCRPQNALFFTLFLCACGGGGSSTTPATEPLPVVLPPSTSVDISTVAKADPGSALPANWQTSGAFMEIYVRGFKDSNGDGIGDLNGITQNLDYLKDLGIKGIWLMPINKSQDHDHGYATSDYRDLETDYGSMTDLQNLITEAHNRGIGVIMDYVINHSAAANPLFVDSKSATNSAYRNWYIWSNTHPNGWSIYGNDPWHNVSGSYHFAGFWDQMPDLNLANPEVVAYQNSNLRFWLNKGIDGFRFDAVGNLFENGPSAWENQPQSYTHMANVRTLLNGYSQRYMVCEAPADPLGFGSSCGSAFAFGHNYDLVNAAKGSTSAIQAVANYFKTSPLTMATMVSNHDSFAGARIYDQVNGNLATYKMVAASYLTQPGIPFIYYGEEIGMAGGSGLSGDWALRTPLSWTANTSNGGFSTHTPFRALSSNVANFNVAAQQADPNSIFNFYKALLTLRNTHPALASGSYQFSTVQGSTLSFQRNLGNDHILVVLNYGSSATSLTVGNLPGNTSLTPLFPSSLSTVSSSAGGQITITPAAQSVSIYQF